METENVELELVNNVWQLDYGGKKGNSNQNYPKVKVEKDEGPAFIVFTIKGSGNAKFSEGQDGPIWVRDNGKPSAKKQDHDQISAWNVTKSGKELVVFDWNDRAVDIHYQLNFDGGAPPLDPIIENGGGTGFIPAPPPPGAREAVGSDVSGLQILGAVLLFLLGAAAGWIWGRRSPQRPVA